MRNGGFVHTLANSPTNLWSWEPLAKEECGFLGCPCFAGLM